MSNISHRDSCTSKVSIRYGLPLQRATFISRPNRFLLRCRLEDSIPGANRIGEIVEAHLADPGRLQELLVPGRILWLRPVSSPKRKTKWSAVLCQTGGGDSLVSLDSTLPNRLIATALAKGALTEFSGWSLVQSEYRLGSSRWDFILRNNHGEELILEVKSVTLVEGGIALFPDAVTARGTRHLKELADLARSDGYRAAVLFVVQRSDARRIRAAAQIDPDFAAALDAARRAGVQVYGRRCQVSLTEIVLADRIPVE